MFRVSISRSAASVTRTSRFSPSCPWNGPAYSRFSRLKVSARPRFIKSLANGSFNGLFGAPLPVVVRVGELYF